MSACVQMSQYQNKIDFKSLQQMIQPEEKNNNKK